MDIRRGQRACLLSNAEYSGDPMANEAVWRSRFLLDLGGFSLRSLRLEAFDREGRKGVARVAKGLSTSLYFAKLSRMNSACNHVPAAKRRDVKARHGSAGKPRVERNGVPEGRHPVSQGIT